jgi:hypothetical protein
MLKIASGMPLVDTMQSPVRKAHNGAIPWVSGRRKYSRLQGSGSERAQNLQIRAPAAASRAA